MFLGTFYNLMILDKVNIFCTVKLKSFDMLLECD